MFVIEKNHCLGKKERKRNKELPFTYSYRRNIKVKGNPIIYVLRYGGPFIENKVCQIYIVQTSKINMPTFVQLVRKKRQP